jgi:hypothetical protein
MSKPFEFTETPDARKIIAEHEGPFGTHKPMLLEFVTSHAANKLELADVKTVDSLYGKNSQYGGKDGLIDVIYIDAQSKKNTDLMLKFKVIEASGTSPLPTMIIVNEQGEVAALQKGVYPSDANKYGADMNSMNVAKLAEGLASVIPNADPNVIFEHISNNVVYDQKPFRLDIPKPAFNFNLNEND